MVVWFVLVVLVVLVFLLTLGRSGSRSDSQRELTLEDGSVWVPTGRYYAGMVTDAELDTGPLLDVAIPLPTFRPLADGTLQLVTRYNYDRESPVGGRSLGLLNKRGGVAIDGLLQAFLQSSLGTGTGSDPEVKIVRWSKTSAYGLRATTQVATEVHDFLFALVPLADRGSQPRRAVSNVGYFSQEVVIAQQAVDVIHRYQRAVVSWQPLANIPSDWYPELAAAIGYWNQHLASAGSDTRFEFLAQPWLGDPTEPSVNLFCLASNTDYIGVGTTVVDGRSGEHLWSRIHIDPASLNRQTQLFPEVRDASSRYLLRYAIIHELGHTLGLRHNFVAQVDGNSSYMAYFPQFYPDAEGQLHFLTNQISGAYDALAIHYGYAPVVGENPLYVPAALQVRIDQDQHLFHTDENVDGDVILSQVHRHAMKDALLAPRWWMRAFQRYRPQLFTQSQEHLRDVQRVFFFLNSITEAVTNAATYVSGYRTDYRRTSLIRDDHTATVLAETTEFLVGETWRLGELGNSLTSVAKGTEGQLVVTKRPRQGSYAVDRVDLAALHLQAVVQVARAMMAPQRVAVMEDPSSFLLRLLTTPSSQSKRTILGANMDKLQLQAVTGILTAVEYYRSAYPTSTQAAFDTTIDSVTTSLKGEHHRTVVAGVVRTVRQLQEQPGRQRCGGCGGCGRPRALCLEQVETAVSCGP
jgi:Met-zincin